jgi:AcrR family transcriptional regulator
MTTKERILDAAAKLFYRDGVRAVSVDSIADKAGVTKRTLYYHFRSKDDLIAAYLAERDQPNLAAFQRWYDEADGSVAERIEAIFRNLAQSARHPKWKGCGFLRTSAELVEFPGHPAIAAGRLHKKHVEDWLCQVIGDRLAAQQVILLMDGAFSVVLLHRDPSYMEAAGAAAARLVTRPDQY